MEQIHIRSYLGENSKNILCAKNNEDITVLLSKGVQFPQAMADDILVKKYYTTGDGGVKNNLSSVFSSA